MKHFIVEITYTAAQERIDEVRPEHRAYMQMGYDRGLLLMSGVLPDRSGAVIVARAKSREEIEEFMSGDPYKKKAVASHRFTEFNPAMFQPFMEGWIRE